jgi:hypothetical protein
MEVRTNVFVSEHGKQPRGYGWWAFSTSPKCDSDHLFFSATGSYREVKATAIDVALNAQVPVLYLMP